MREIDVHHKKKYFDYLKTRIEAMPQGEPKTTLIKYIEWHEEQINKDKLTYGSALKSLQIAVNICDQFPKPGEITGKQLESWFEAQNKRNLKHRTGGDNLKELKKQVSLGTIQKFQSQLLKFLKFSEFLKLNKPIAFFNSKRMPVPEIARFCFVDIKKNKTIEPPLVSQEQVKQICDYLLSKGNYVSELTGVLCAFMNDVGCRYSEAVSLRHQDFTFQEGYLLVQLTQSKTKTRTNVVLLSRQYLSKWMAKCPTKDNKEGLVFCTRKGKLVSHSALRNELKTALKELKINWKPYSAMHYFRHLAVSRNFEMPGNLAEYYFGWESRSIRAAYSAYSWKGCLPYLMKGNKGNPMADKSLSYLDEGQKSQDEVIEQMIEEKLQRYLAKRKG